MTWTWMDMVDMDMMDMDIPPFDDTYYPDDLLLPKQHDEHISQGCYTTSGNLMSVYN